MASAPSVASGACPRRRRPRRPRRRQWPVVVALGLFSLSTVLPLLFMAATAFRTQADWDRSKIGLPTTASLGAFERAWTGANISLYFRNSVIVTLEHGGSQRRLRDACGLLVLQDPLAASRRRLLLRAGVDRDSAAAHDGADLRRDGAARPARHVRLGDPALHRAQPAVQRLSDDGFLPGRCRTS